MTEPILHPFIARLQELAKNEDRGALADLRRGLGKPPGSAPEMYRYVEPFLPSQRSSTQENAYYLVAALFGFHPLSTPNGNFGSHMAKTLSDESADALERRFTILLSSHFNDLSNYLRQAVSFLKSKDIPVNWNQLFWDLQKWDDEERKVQKKWANSFWNYARISEPQTAE